METLSGRSSISTAVIRWAWKTHGREDMHFFLTQLLWLHRHSLLCPLPLTCMWTHCGQKMITDWLPCSTRNKLHACMYTAMCTRSVRSSSKLSHTTALTTYTHFGRQAMYGKAANIHIMHVTALHTIYIPGLSFPLLFPLTSSLVLSGLSTVP